MNTKQKQHVPAAVKSERQSQQPREVKLPDVFLAAVKPTRQLTDTEVEKFGNELSALAHAYDMTVVHPAERLSVVQGLSHAKRGEQLLRTFDARIIARDGDREDHGRDRDLSCNRTMVRYAAASPLEMQSNATEES